ncbi:MAG: SDR family oxidoreductase [Myxococcales bacterium]|nr:SDR family oxidoreductase [Myxococcales bacterium]
MTTQTLLVTGASGHLGRRVIAHLLGTQGVSPAQIIATTRSPEKLADLAARGVQVRAADFSVPEGLPAAFAGADRLLLVSTDQVGARLTQQRAAIQAAQAAGVQHVVYTSMPAPERSPVIFAPEHAGTELALAESGLPGWTVLRNHWYFENVFMALPAIAATGVWATAAGDRGTADISRDDLAQAAAAVLASDRTGTATFTLSGGEALTTAQQAAGLAEVLGRPIQVVYQTADERRAALLGAGLPAPFAEMLVSFEVNQAQGYMEPVTGDFQAITGRAPQSHAAWLAGSAGALRGAAGR